MAVTWNITVADGDIQTTKTLPVNLEKGVPTFLVGANGSGKSALIQHAVAEFNSGPGAKRISANRQVWTSSSHITMTPQNRREFDQSIRSRDTLAVSRWREYSPEGRWSAALFDLVEKENTLARRIMGMAYDSDPNGIDAIVKSEKRPFAQINDLLKASGLPVTIKNLEGGRIRATHKDSDKSYSISEMSDGERSAVLIAAEVLTAKSGVVLLIDAPERHLNRGITAPFLSALFAERDDCYFVISTHETALPLANPDAQTLVVRSCKWPSSGDPNKMPDCWDIVTLKKDDDLPESVKRAILGARKRILFVEGESQSGDLPLYTALFPDSELSIIPAGSRKNVINAVDGLRNSEAHHDVKAFGLVDGDGLSDAGALAKRGIYALPCYSVESLYYCEDAIASVARLQAATLDYDADDMIAAAKGAAIAVLREEELAERMAARICERQTEAQIEAQKPTWKSIRDNRGAPMDIRVEPDYTAELERYKRAAADRDIEGLVARYPLRESKVFGRIASELHLLSKEDYQKAVVTRASNCPDLAKSLKRRIEPLADAIQQNPA